MTPDELARIHRAAFRVPRPWSAAEFSAFLADPTVRLIGRTAGFILGRIVGGEAEILTLAVLPESRRRGTGRSLVTEFISRAEQEGAGRVFLEVAAGNAPAIGLYLDAGFRDCGRRPHYYRLPDGGYEDALILARALSPAP